MNKKIRICLFVMTMVINLLSLSKFTNMQNNRIELFLNIQPLLEREWEEKYDEEPIVSYKSNFKGNTIIHESKDGKEKVEYDLKNSSYYAFCILFIINLIIILITLYKKFYKRFRVFLMNYF